jgi:histidinol-phosphate aminotransferase
MNQPKSPLDNVPAGISLPLNLGLNDGTYCPQGSLDAMMRFNHRTSLRNYTDANNDRLRKAIADKDGVSPDNVFLQNGSGPILKQVVPHVIKTAIKSSPRRIARHLLQKNGYPIITPRLTYSKVPRKASELGLTVHMIPLRPEDSFKLDIRLLDERLSKQEGFVYLCTPNNPTGNVLITRAELEPLLQKYPRSTFWIDEAYVQYLDETKHEYISPLVARYPNLLVSRTFSFAYGLAGLRVGYLLGPTNLVNELNKQLTDYRIGMLQEAMIIAGLEDKEHLPFVRAECARERAVIIEGLNKIPFIEAYNSETNFVFARFTDGRTGAWLKGALKERGVLIKNFDPYAGETYDEFFRITLGLANENRWFVELMHEVAGKR